MYGSWDIKHDKQSILSFWVIFCPLTFLTTWKIKNENVTENIITLHLHITNDDHMCMVRDISSATDRIFCHFVQKMKIKWCMFLEMWSTKDTILSHSGQFSTLLLPSNPENRNFYKMKKMPVYFIILHKCTINDNHIKYDS